MDDNHMQIARGDRMWLFKVIVVNRFVTRNIVLFIQSTEHNITNSHHSV